MKNYKSLSVYKDRDVYIFGASGGGEIVKDFLMKRNRYSSSIMLTRFTRWIHL